MKIFTLPAAFVAAFSLCAGAFAGPGAHGPGGEHLDERAPVLSAGNTVPRVEAKSELFELVARIEGGALSILIDRYDTNEPVLGAAVEVESGPLKEKAVFRREQGDYAVTNAKLLEALSAPGSHAIVFTVNAGKDSDLLDGALQVRHPEGNGGQGYFSLRRPAVWIGLAAAILVAAAAIFLAIRRRRRTFR
jgi:hypothetical protein